MKPSGQTSYDKWHGIAQSNLGLLMKQRKMNELDQEPVAGVNRGLGLLKRLCLCAGDDLQSSLYQYIDILLQTHHPHPHCQFLHPPSPTPQLFQDSALPQCFFFSSISFCIHHLPFRAFTCFIVVVYLFLSTCMNCQQVSEQV